MLFQERLNCCWLCRCFQVLVEAGQSVQEGETLVVMEAMKMEVSARKIMNSFRHEEDPLPPFNRISRKMRVADVTRQP